MTAENELAQHCQRAAQTYREKPGLAGSALTIIDLYEIIGMLAARVAELERKAKS